VTTDVDVVQVDETETTPAFHEAIGHVSTVGIASTVAHTTANEEVNSKEKMMINRFI
jgi:hypothetical protein